MKNPYLLGSALIALLITGCASKETEICSVERVRTLALAGSGFMFSGDEGTLIAPEEIVLTVKNSKFTEMKDGLPGCKMHVSIEGPLAYVLGWAQTMGSGPAVAFAVSENAEAKERIVVALKGIDESNRKVSALPQELVNDELDRSTQKIKASGFIEYTVRETEQNSGQFLVDRIIPTKDQVVISEVFAQLDSEMNYLANAIVAKSPGAVKAEGTGPAAETNGIPKESQRDSIEAK